MISYTLFATRCMGPDHEEVSMSLAAASTREELEPLLKALTDRKLSDPSTLFDIEETTPWGERGTAKPGSVSST